MGGEFDGEERDSLVQRVKCQVMATGLQTADFIDFHADGFRGPRFLILGRQ